MIVIALLLYKTKNTFYKLYFFGDLNKSQLPIVTKFNTHLSPSLLMRR